MKVKKNNAKKIGQKGITLLSLAITISVMIILAGVIMSVESSDTNNLLELAEAHKEQVEKNALEEEIKTYLAENPPSNYTELIGKLTRYGRVENRENAQSAVLITDKGNYSIYVKDIWNINF